MLPTLGDIIQGLFTKLLVLFILFTLTYVYRKKVGAVLKRLGYYLTNEEVQLSLKRIDKYTTNPSSSFSHSTFVKIRESVSREVSDPDIQDGTMRLSVEGVPVPIIIRLDETHTFTEGTEAKQDVKLAIFTDGELRFGYRTDESLRVFQDVSEEISRVVQNECFQTQRPAQSYVLGELKKGIPPGVKDIDDEELDLEAHVQGSTMYLTLKDPRRLKESLRKYFRPT